MVFPPSRVFYFILLKTPFSFVIDEDRSEGRPSGIYRWRERRAEMSRYANRDHSLSSIDPYFCTIHFRWRRPRLVTTAKIPALPRSRRRRDCQREESRLRQTNTLVADRSYHPASPCFWTPSLPWSPRPWSTPTSVGSTSDVWSNLESCHVQIVRSPATWRTNLCGDDQLQWIRKLISWRSLSARYESGRIEKCFSLLPMLHGLCRSSCDDIVLIS
jgi:hypothetical protein